ncbi:MAG: hypothetical protein K6U00_13025 [Armatimonadetes bacterium]|nr:hypothetical protein [Armatimonadota bacterium]
MPRLVVLSLLLIMCACTVAIMALAREPIREEPLQILVASAPTRSGSRAGTRLAAVVCNSGREKVYIRRDLGVPHSDPRYDPLAVHVVDLASGTSVDARHEYKRATVVLSSRDFIGLDPGRCYGTIVDIEEEFLVKHGRRYKVTFSYSSLSPQRVGSVAPWQGTVRSQEVTVSVP